MSDFEYDKCNIISCSVYENGRCKTNTRNGCGKVKAYEQGRADAITEIITHISACENEAYANCEPIVGSVLMAMRIKAEQLKSQTDTDEREVQNVLLFKEQLKGTKE